MLTGHIIVAMKDKDSTADLKKFISQAFAQQGNQLRNEMKIMRQELLSEINTKFGSLEIKFDDLQTEMRESFIAVGESFEELRRDRERDMKYINKTYARHDREISVLQEQVAPLVNL